MSVTKKVSIIVPVYNGEKHIEFCIKSLLKQTYTNIELVIINDGSNDGTKEILDKWAKIDDRIYVIHKVNEGVSVARNIGLMCCCGQYILFVDSDDKLREDAIERLLPYMQDDDSYDLVLFGYEVIGSDNRKNDTEVLQNISKIDTQFLKNEIIKSVIATNKNIFGYIWRALYSKKMLETSKVRFPKNIKISEDYMFLLDAINSSDRVAVIPEELYQYCIGESSMSIKYIPSLLQDMMYVNNWMYDNIVKSNEILQEGYNCSVCNTYLRYVQNSYRDKNRKFHAIHREIKAKRKEYGFQYYINQEWNKFNNFDLKSALAMVFFHFHCDFIYEILFTLKERRGRKKK